MPESTIKPGRGNADSGEKPASEQQTGPPSQEIPPTVLKRKTGLRTKVGDIPREIPVRLGRYLIDGEIGRGAMGVVYRAHQDGLDRIVALKLLLAGTHASDAHKRRFEREARAIAKLRHPNIISVHEVGEYENQPFFTMDYIDGLPLDTFMEQNGITSTRLIADMCARICDAVFYAHENGIIHRDLKPGNIIVDRNGNPMVMDFGLAKDMYSNSMVSMTGDIMGTPAFMSPEQAGGHVSATGERSDVYSMGAILYCMLTKEPPFQGNTLMETLGRVLNEDPPPLVDVNPMIEGELGAICMKAMEKVPSMRYRSAADMSKDLRAFINGEPITAKAWTWRTRARRWLLRHRLELAGGLIAATLLVYASFLGVKILSNEYLDVARAHLGSDKAPVRAEAVTTLGREIASPDQLRPDQVTEAAETLLQAHLDPDPEVRRNLLLMIVDHGGEDAIRLAANNQSVSEWILMEAAENESPEVRNLAMKAMGVVPNEAFINFLIMQLNHPDAEVRIKAVRSLGKQKGMRIVAPLMQTAISDPECRAYAEEALENYHRRSRFSLFDRQDTAVKHSLEKLTTVMADRNRQLEAVLEEIPNGGSEPPDPYDEARSILASTDLLAKHRALFELGNADHPMAVSLLIETLGDVDVGSVAAYELSGRVDKKTRVALILLLDDASPTVRANAALCLGISGAQEAVDSLIVALSNETNEEATVYIIRALGELRSPDARIGLRNAASRNERVRAEVEKALERIR
jgi:HEAT repeat protein/predicted Ser/Thr protein kinase